MERKKRTFLKYGMLCLTELLLAVGFVYCVCWLNSGNGDWGMIVPTLAFYVVSFPVSMLHGYLCAKLCRGVVAPCAILLGAMALGTLVGVIFFRDVPFDTLPIELWTALTFASYFLVICPYFVAALIARTQRILIPNLIMLGMITFGVILYSIPIQGGGPDWQDLFVMAVIVLIPTAASLLISGIWRGFRLMAEWDRRVAAEAAARRAELEKNRENP